MAPTKKLPQELKKVGKLYSYYKEEDLDKLFKTFRPSTVATVATIIINYTLSFIDLSKTYIVSIAIVYIIYSFLVYIHNSRLNNVLALKLNIKNRGEPPHAMAEAICTGASYVIMCFDVPYLIGIDIIIILIFLVLIKARKRVYALRQDTWE